MGKVMSARVSDTRVSDFPLLVLGWDRRGLCSWGLRLWWGLRGTGVTIAGSRHSWPDFGPVHKSCKLSIASPRKECPQSPGSGDCPAQSLWRAGSPGAGCSGPSPTGFSISAKLETAKTCWAACWYFLDVFNKLILAVIPWKTMKLELASVSLKCLFLLFAFF